MSVAVGAKGVLVMTGHGQAELRRHSDRERVARASQARAERREPGGVQGAPPIQELVAHAAPTLLEAASWILTDAGFPKEMP